MSVREIAIAEADPSSEPLLQTVQDCSEAAQLAEAGMAVYLAGLEDYEERLARGEVRWF